MAANPKPTTTTAKPIAARRRVKWGVLLPTFLVSAVLLTLVLPRAESVGYFYNLGEPWHYPSLYASEQFPIYKTADEFKAEQETVRSDVQPYFTCDSTMSAKQLATYRNDVAQGKFSDVPSNYLQHIARLLQAVYEEGVMSMADAENMAAFNPQNIRIVTGNEAESRSAKGVYNIRTAYETVMNSDTANFHRDILARVSLQDYIVPNIALDKKKTQTAVDEAVNAISQTHGMVKKGEKIIDRGEIVTEQKLKLLDSYQRNLTKHDEDAHRGLWELLLGQGFFVVLILLAATLYLFTFRRQFLADRNAILLLFTLLTVFPLLTHLLLIFKTLNVYIIPFALVTIFVRIFFDSRTALAFLLFTLFLSSLCLSQPYEFLFVEVTASVTALFSVSELTERSQLLRITFVVTAMSLFAALVFDLSQGLGFEGLSRAHYLYIASGGLLLLMAYPLLYLLERVFSFSSTMTMLELMNINHPLLSRLSQQAQGTWSHSMQVANLATDVAKKIGARVQLVRTGAFYHDIGKMTNPAYFTENQTGVNPHDRLANEKESAKIIISHVTEGIKLAKEYNLPKEVCDFILTHHGRGKVRYFYIQWKNAHPNEQIDESLFTYPGPNPMTKEQAILMMCDGVEAASRSLPEYSPETITNLVNRIVDGIVGEGYLKRCPISFLDIEVAKHTLIDSLKRMYHTRIAYPELKKSEE